MACCIPDGSSPSLGPYYYSIERGEAFVLYSSPVATESITNRPLYQDSMLTKEIGIYQVQKLYGESFSNSTSVINLPNEQIVFELYDKLESNGHPKPNEIIVSKITNTSGYALCKEGFIVLKINNTPIRELLVYFSEPPSK